MAGWKSGDGATTAPAEELADDAAERELEAWHELTSPLVERVRERPLLFALGALVTGYLIGRLASRRG